MRLPEQRLWDYLRTNLRPYGVRLVRVENVVEEGTPDVCAGCAGKTTWIELKAQEVIPVRSGTPLLGEKKGLSIDQRNWALSWRAQKCHHLIVIGAGAGRSRELLVLSGDLADLVNGMSLDQLRGEACARSIEALYWELKGPL